MNVSFQGFDEQLATFEADSRVKPGVPVKMSGNGQVALCGAADVPCGFAVGVRDGYASVQLRGYFRIAYTGSLNLGRQLIVADSGGKIKASSNTTGISVLITDLDSSASTAGLIL